jgi:hypothetical protein
VGYPASSHEWSPYAPSLCEENPGSPPRTTASPSLYHCRKVQAHRELWCENCLRPYDGRDK